MNIDKTLIKSKESYITISYLAASKPLGPGDYVDLEPIPVENDILRERKKRVQVIFINSNIAECIRKQKFGNNIGCTGIIYG